jgi:hypothetical protein
MDIKSAFSTPLAFARMNSPEALNAQLRDLFLQCEAQGPRFANPDPYTHRNDALFESSFTLFDWPHEPVARLRDFCWSSLYHVIGALNQYDASTLQKLCIAHESWFHVTRKGGYFGVHNHPLHSWSGVYCVCQDGDNPDSDSGKLTFINPLAMNTMFIDMATHRMKPPFSMGNLSIRLQPGQLVVFPSWLLHEVTPFEPVADGLRITVAFNARFQMQGVEPPRSPFAP